MGGPIPTPDPGIFIETENKSNWPESQQPLNCSVAEMLRPNNLPGAFPATMEATFWPSQQVRPLKQRAGGAGFRLRIPLAYATSSTSATYLFKLFRRAIARIAIRL